MQTATGTAPGLSCTIRWSGYRLGALQEAHQPSSPRPARRAATT